MKLLEMFRNSFVSLLLLALSMYAVSAYADVVVVVSAKSALTSLTAEQVTKIFLGKTNTFPSGENAVPIDHIEGSPIRNEFYARIVHKTPSQISSYWTKIIYTGDGYPPRQVDSDAVIRKVVANNPNAIGYIDKISVDGSVRVILAP